MTNTTSQKASCLCGSVTINASNLDHRVAACHCAMCRKWGGGPLLAVECSNVVEFEGKENITIYESSAWAERGFCSQCGTHLFYRLKQGYQYFIPVGLFSDVDNLVFVKQIFTDEKPAYYCFANETENLTAEEVYAEYTEITQS
ncbi:GFA family protein [Gloeocapsa sp. PCC 73106]|uniref:GFA family protein n=1 Tax=Gloeocapsa sp. PCC 73106 TaxID=102232 RepID=UPI0002AC61FF|nr:GFA family protein [Gloeocapsa sp. PCC 73106]ELR97799.1 hypothetical protein GLO73106DRAFT_00016160 [Gloeocapsa sp. PCC 73106]